MVTIFQQVFQLYHRLHGFCIKKETCIKPFNMKKCLYCIACLIIGLLMITNMQAQSLKSLEDNNGFKKYKLGSKFILGLGIKHKDEDGADKIVIDYTKDMIGDIPVKAIELYYLRDTLAKIVVRISPEYYEKLIDAVKSSFGPPTQDISNNQKVNHDTAALSPNYYKDDHIWRTNRLRMEYFYSYPKVTSGAYG